MSLDKDLLKQADFLVCRERGRPSQASLRRSVSAAYYGLFHLLASEASRLVASDRLVQARLNRIYSHREMAKVAKTYADRKLPKYLQTLDNYVQISADIVRIAQTFVQLQQARHDADYDLAKVFTRSEARELVKQVRWAFDTWHKVKKQDDARLFLGSILTGDRWEKGA